MKVSVIGCGFVGLITAVGLASKGNMVTAIDIDQSRLSKVKQGVSPFYEPGVEKLLKEVLRQGNLRVSSSIDDTIDCEVILICVQTPPKSNGAIDLRILKAAAGDLATVFKRKSRPRVVVVRSTVIPGTTDEVIKPIFQQKGLRNNIEVAFNPEFLREGSALDDFLSPDRIVIGTNSKQAEKVLKRLYSVFDSPIIVTTPSTAELSKYTSNTLLATLISFSNEIARICEQTANVDVEDVLNIVHQDRRFVYSSNGNKKLGILSYIKAGCGFGGSCLPKDLSALIAYARSKKEDPNLLKAVKKVNLSQPIRMVDFTSEILGGLNKRKITVLGIAFKGGTDDTRESPGLRIVDELLRQKADITIYDSLVNLAHLQSYNKKGISIASSIKEAIGSADVCIIASSSPEFKKIKNWIKYTKKEIIIIDGRRILERSIYSNKNYFAVGISKKGSGLFK